MEEMQLFMSVNMLLNIILMQTGLVLWDFLQEVQWHHQHCLIIQKKTGRILQHRSIPFSFNHDWLSCKRCSTDLYCNASDDGLGLAPHSIDLYNKWLSTKHDAELLYARGNHGFGMKKQNIPTDNWIERFYDWMGVQGLLNKKAVDHALDIYEKKEFKFADGQVLPYRILFTRKL
jgi:hypothetical protein